MVPPGTWKFFFTSNMSQGLVSKSHTIYSGITTPKEFNFIFDLNNKKETTCDVNIIGYNEVFIPEDLQEID